MTKSACFHTYQKGHSKPGVFSPQQVSFGGKKHLIIRTAAKKSFLSLFPTPSGILTDLRFRCSVCYPAYPIEKTICLFSFITVGTMSSGPGNEISRTAVMTSAFLTGPVNRLHAVPSMSSGIQSH